MEPVVSPAWLVDHGVDVVVCDVRTAMTGSDPASDFAAGHLPGAVFVDLDDALADPPGGTAGRHPLPTPERFAIALGAAGIGNDATVVAYDAGNGGFAARLVWMLRIIGQPATLLDGGLGGWTGPIETGPPVHRSAARSAVPWPSDALATADDVDAHLERGGVVVDSRDTARHRGEVEPIDPVAGHVPGSINLPFVDNVGGDGRFLGVHELAGRFAAVGADSNAIVYCGSGVTACHNALAMERAGLGRPRVYVGSWSGWSADAARPVATGPASAEGP